MVTSPADLAVIGAGPAGLAAAVSAADLGLSVALVDAGPRPGGQYHRHAASDEGAARPHGLHKGWGAFMRQVGRLDAHRASGRVRYLAGRHVWSLQLLSAAEGLWGLYTTATDPEPGPDANGVRLVQARGVVLATGAYERQLPFPGWTLPGVVTAGGAQAMLKSGMATPGRRVVVAGSGPLLLATAASLVSEGVRVPAVVEAGGYLRYAARLDALAANPAKLSEGLVCATALMRHRVRLLTRSAVTEAHGTDRVRAVTVAGLDRAWRPVAGSERMIACDALAVGHGLIPQLELATALGCATRTAPDGAPALEVDARQRTTVSGVWAAGESTGIGGAQLAAAEGELAALAAAAALGTARGGTALAARTAALSRRRDRLRAFADLMAAAHRPGTGWTEWLRDDTEVCRCEEVTAAVVKEAAAEYGARDRRTAKLLTRAGMGWCQGRMCGTAVAFLAAPGRDAGPDADRRPLSCPVPLGDLARLRHDSGFPED
ncbi:FAD-dependent oxidoreductase [Streptomyces sp. NPDC020800]|uniref:FAD-dependent oxidoreductase n=1 Tax=Streptomyces sp. NPDC020800 TaxID=3365092 RepID=UPI00379281CC